MLAPPPASLAASPALPPDAGVTTDPLEKLREAARVLRPCGCGQLRHLDSCKLKREHVGKRTCGCAQFGTHRQQCPLFVQAPVLACGCKDVGRHQSSCPLSNKRKLPGRPCGCGAKGRHRRRCPLSCEPLEPRSCGCPAFGRHRQSCHLRSNASGRPNRPCGCRPFGRHSKDCLLNVDDDCDLSKYRPPDDESRKAHRHAGMLSPSSATDPSTSNSVEGALRRHRTVPPLTPHSLMFMRPALPHVPPPLRCTWSAPFALTAPDHPLEHPAFSSPITSRSAAGETVYHVVVPRAPASDAAAGPAAPE